MRSIGPISLLEEEVARSRSITLNSSTVVWLRNYLISNRHLVQNSSMLRTAANCYQRWIFVSLGSFQRSKSNRHWAGTFHIGTIAAFPKFLTKIKGLLGNCWFISALAVVAERYYLLIIIHKSQIHLDFLLFRPDLMEKLIISKTYNHLGIYELRFAYTFNFLTTLLNCDLIHSP